MNKKTIRDIDLGGKRVLMRVDFNCPLTADGSVADDLRIREAIPTLRACLEAGASLILMTHLGRPKGRVREDLRLDQVAGRLQALLARPVRKLADTSGVAVQEAAAGLEQGEILLLENLRFHPGEEKNDSRFAKALASLADVYVNDAFGTAHRAHSSTVGVAGYLPATELTELLHHLVARTLRRIDEHDLVVLHNET